MSFVPLTDRQVGIIWTACTRLALLGIVAVVVTAVWGLGQVLDVFAPLHW